MEKYKKFFYSLSLKQQAIFNGLIDKLLSRDFEGLDIKKLKGYEHYYSLRKGKIRIIYSYDSKNVVLINMGFRKDVYKD